MVSKILKIQLLTLFLITLVSCLVFYYQSNLPDNYFSITSNNMEFSFFSYYLISSLVFIEYYSGPWVLVPFFIFTICYAFIFSSRKSYFDLGAIVFLIVSSLFIFYIFYPQFLGRGIRQVVKTEVSYNILVASIIASTIIFVASVFRMSFFTAIKNSFEMLISIPKNIRTMYEKLTNNRFRNRSLMKFDYFSKGKQKFITFLKGDGQKVETKDFILVEAPSKEEFVGYKDDIKAKDAREILKTSPAKIKKRNSNRDEKNYKQIVKFNGKKNNNRNIHPDDKYFNDIISRIEDKLLEFRIEGRIINILKGPVVDTYELELGIGVKVSKITSSSEDLSMALHGAPIRIVYPMRGRTTVGIEVPRNPREVIFLDEIMESKEFNSSNFELPLAMGKDAFGQPLIVDLTSMPHMLVAGATGAGKSVFINTLLVSLLVRKSPSKMKLVLIDPKQLELSLYAKLPHLIIPVVTDAKTASYSLAWVVEEMERRYSILKEFKVRNLKSFNDKLSDADDEMLSSIQKYYDEENDYELPYIVVVVDEFADLILTKAGKEIEHNICRLAGKARAAGIHLVIATQRPSVDVITGLIKSNFPTRVSFRVTTSVDSRTILNAMGAEKLLGKGDMLYKNGVETIRVHSSYVDEDEIEDLAQNLCTIPSDYNSKAVDFIENGGDKESDPYAYGSHINQGSNLQEDDTLLKEAVDIVIEYRAASASMLQRRLKVGYNRAANLIEVMEQKGIVGPARGAKPRKVLLNSPAEM